MEPVRCSPTTIENRGPMMTAGRVTKPSSILAGRGILGRRRDPVARLMISAEKQLGDLCVIFSAAYSAWSEVKLGGNRPRSVNS